MFRVSDAFLGAVDEVSRLNGSIEEHQQTLPCRCSQGKRHTKLADLDSQFRGDKEWNA